MLECVCRQAKYTHDENTLTHSNNRQTAVLTPLDIEQKRHPDASAMPDPVRAAQYVMANKSQYVDDLLARYQERCEYRKASRIPVLMLCGRGGAGKDFAARYICDNTQIVYSGSTSSLIAPLVADSLGVSVKTAFEQRRNHREFWYEFCNEVRRNDASLLARMNLAEGDMVVGPRDDFEVYETVKRGVVDLSIWIDNPRIASVDSTVKFGPDDCDMTIINGGSRFSLYRKLDKLIDVLKSHYFANQALTHFQRKE